MVSEETRAQLQLEHAGLQEARSALQQREADVAAADAQLRLRQAAVEALTGALAQESWTVATLQAIAEEKGALFPELEEEWR